MVKFMRFLASRRNDCFLDIVAFGRGGFAAKPQNLPSQMPVNLTYCHSERNKMK